MCLGRGISEAFESRVVRPAWRDDVLIHGRDDAVHDSCLKGFMKKCQQKGIKLNLARL